MKMKMSCILSSFICILVGRSSKGCAAFSTKHKFPLKHNHLLKKLDSSTFRWSSLNTSRCMSIQDTSRNYAQGISRLDTLTELLTLTGAPGSKHCHLPQDLVPIQEVNKEQDTSELLNLHPHLLPIAKSKSTGYYICALQRAYADDAMYVSSKTQPLPIVESAPNAPGYSLIALNSEHLMRRIACEADFNGSQIAVNIYNSNLGQGQLADVSLDTPYQPGSVQTLGYGLSKYCLLRVGPFPDLYQEMALNHLNKGDESSSLIAAEASNSKFTGFGSTFRFYAEMLNKFPNRLDETKDAARVCLRMPMASIGCNIEDYVAVSIMAGLANIHDSTDVAMDKLKEMYDKIKKHEREEQSKAGAPGQTTLTVEQQAIEDVNDILDQMVFRRSEERDWSSIRKEIGDIYGKVSGLEDMANFVDPSRTWA